MTPANRNLKAKCGNCAGAIGITSCMIPMFASAIGIGSVVGMNSMGGGSAASTLSSGPSPSLLAELSSFFSGPEGEIVLLVSFALMAFGMWYGRRLKPMVVGVAAAVIIFVGMFAYYSLALAVLGSAIMILAYLSAYSQSFASLVRLSW